MELGISILLVVFACIMFRRQFRFELRSLMRNDLGTHGRALFLRKGSIVTFGILVGCELLVQILAVSKWSNHGTGSSTGLIDLIGGTGLGPFTLASLIALELWIAGVFRSAWSRGLFEHLRLTPSTRQQVLVGVFWPVWIAAAISWNLHGVFSVLMEGRAEAFLKLPAVMLRQSAIAFFLVSYYFCSFIHGLGSWRMWAVLFYSICVTQLVLTPFYVIGFLMPKMGGAVLCNGQAVIYFIVGTLFYRSFRQYDEKSNVIMHALGN